MEQLFEDSAPIEVVKSQRPSNKKSAILERYPKAFSDLQLTLQDGTFHQSH
ncbi:hypothetical protein [Spirosoma fluviale]|uniref:Uncharacterized protein n=1 Tax=Spirosoma fluviale TaxID=1597977 RepID=A0A286FD20_9BACT|nr:hypothetical protein [Spirosoma fluviale]SOD81083.1 hypothetical protein SAMN06269250_1668 [Spirosoma fluviale]